MSRLKGREKVSLTCELHNCDKLQRHPANSMKTFQRQNFPFTSIDFTMTNADVTGQQHMWIEDFDLRIAGMFMNFNMTIPLMEIEGDHRTRANMFNGIVSVPISGQGRVKMYCRNVRINGIGQMQTIANGHLDLHRFTAAVLVPEVEANLTGFGLLDGAVSRMISSSAPDMVADNQDRINENLSESLLPGINRFLNQHTLVTLVNLMADRNQNPPPRRCFG